MQHFLSGCVITGLLPKPVELELLQCSSITAAFQCSNILVGAVPLICARSRQQTYSLSLWPLCTARLLTHGMYAQEVNCTFLYVCVFDCYHSSVNIRVSFTGRGGGGGGICPPPGS